MDVQPAQNLAGERKAQPALVALEQGLQYLENAECDRAIECFTEAIRLCPTLTDAYIARACAYEDKGDFDLAIADCAEAIRLNPECARVYQLRGHIHGKAGNWAMAERDISKARRIEAKQQ